MPYDGAVPTKPQIERQLTKMLENDSLTSRPQQAKLLEFIVRTTLKGEEPTEKYIREQLFPSPPYKIDSPIARRTADFLRKTLLEYYEENIDNALVVIHLPEQPPGKRIKFQAGEAYKPHFEYNIHHQITKDYELGCHYLLNGNINTIPDAVEVLGDVLKREPHHVGAMLHVADAHCYTVLLGILPERREDLIALAKDLIDCAMTLEPVFWHTYSSRAFLHYCQGEFDAARRAFETALTLDRELTESFSIYSLFLVASDRGAEALQLTEFVTDEQSVNPNVYVNRGMHLAAAKRFDEAERAFERALVLDRNCWAAHIGALRLNLARGRTAKSQEHAERLKLLMDSDEYDHWMMIVRALHEAD